MEWDSFRGEWDSRQRFGLLPCDKKAAVRGLWTLVVAAPEIGCGALRTLVWWVGAPLEELIGQ